MPNWKLLQYYIALWVCKQIHSLLMHFSRYGSGIACVGDLNMIMLGQVTMIVNTVDYFTSYVCMCYWHDYWSYVLSSVN